MTTMTRRRTPSTNGAWPLPARWATASRSCTCTPAEASGWSRSRSTPSSSARSPSSRSRPRAPTTPTAGPGSCWRPRSPAGSSIRASCRSMAWASTTRAVLTTRCASCAASRSKRRSPSFMQADATRGRDARDRTLELRQLLGRFVNVCHTMAYAHSRGVLHRDLKPANVLLGPYNETLIVDWGLAKVLGGKQEPARRLSSRALPAWTNRRRGPGTFPPLGQSSSTETIAGAAFGTPAFMSPEQAEGQLDRLGPASDIYSLGAVLYTLLCGRPPFEYAWCEVTSLLARVKNGEFPAPRQANHRVQAARGHLPEGHGQGARRTATPAPRTWPPRSSAGWATSRWPPIGSPGGHELARWGRRHRPLVASAAVLLVTAVAALSLGILLLGRAQRETEAQRRARREAEQHGHVHVGRGERPGRVAAPPRLRQPRQPGVPRVPRRQRRPRRADSLRCPVAPAELGMVPRPAAGPSRARHLRERRRDPAIRRLEPGVHPRRPSARLRLGPVVSAARRPRPAAWWSARWSPGARSSPGTVWRAPCRPWPSAPTARPSSPAPEPAMP